MSIQVSGHTIGHIINNTSCTTTAYEEGSGKIVATFSGKNLPECLAQVKNWAKNKKLEVKAVEGARLPPSKAEQEKEAAEKLRKAQEAATLSADDLVAGGSANTAELERLAAEAKAAAEKTAKEEAEAKAKEDAEIAAQAKAAASKK